MKFPDNLPPLTLYERLVPHQEQALFLSYLGWVQLLAVRGLGLKKITPKTFDRLYRAVLKPKSANTFLGHLQQEFIKKNLSLSLLLEPLDGFEWLSKNRYPLVFSNASPVILTIISPLTRFISVLNNQHPPFYQPFANLMFVYLALYVLNLPEFEKILKNAGVQTDTATLTGNLPLILREAKQVLPVTGGGIFKLKIAFFLALARQLIKKNAIHTKNKIDFLDYVNAFLYGLWYILTIRATPLGKNKL
ncbi:MAG: hypothetical protein J6J35_06815 [Alphaproteobacteria bacterium]|nr:hypothetical protein [Alphaproteobacteria bacterium]